MVPPDNHLNVNITDYVYLLPNGSANYDEVAPSVCFPYRMVTYTIVQADATPISEHWVNIMKFQVMVLASSFVQLLNTTVNPIFPITLMAIGGTLTTISLIKWKRLHGNLERSSDSKNP
jgi:hypothetical protein